MKMKALGLTEFGGPEVLKIIEMERPVPGKNQVLIKTIGTSVNYADIKTRKGAFFGASTVFPIIPGLDVFGSIEEIGGDKEAFMSERGLAKGDRIVGFPHDGSYAEYVLVDKNLVFKVPDQISFEKATACPLVAFASYMMLVKSARLEEGESILIHSAAGGMGTTLIQLAKAMGAGQVFGLVSNEDKITVAKNAGADLLIVESGKEMTFPQKLMDLTAGRGVDIILDSLGGEYTEKGLDCLANYGRIVSFGSTSGSFAKIDAGKLYSSNRSLIGYSSVTIRNTKPEWFLESAESIFRYMVEGKLKMVIADIFELAEAGKAQRLLEEGKAKGKIILKVNNSLAGSTL